MTAKWLQKQSNKKIKMADKSKDAYCHPSTPQSNISNAFIRQSVCNFNILHDIWLILIPTKTESTLQYQDSTKNYLSLTGHKTKKKKRLTSQGHPPICIVLQLTIH